MKKILASVILFVSNQAFAQLIIPMPNYRDTTIHMRVSPTEVTIKTRFSMHCSLYNCDDSTLSSIKRDLISRAKKDCENNGGVAEGESIIEDFYKLRKMLDVSVKCNGHTYAQGLAAGKKLRERGISYHALSTTSVEIYSMFYVAAPEGIAGVVPATAERIQSIKERIHKRLSAFCTEHKGTVTEVLREYTYDTFNIVNGIGQDRYIELYPGIKCSGFAP
jgi:hypothetical protein